jgi:hypothetical protein
LCVPRSEFGTCSFRKPKGMADQAVDLAEILDSCGVAEKN